MCLVIPVEGDLHGGQFPVDAVVVFFDLVQIVVDIPVFRRGLAGRVRAGVYPHLRIALPQTVQKNLAAAQLRHADKVWREYRFSLLMPGEKYWGERALGEEVLLQGVVDCFFDTPEGLVVVDFKTDRVKGEEQRRRTAEYRSQVEAYSDALEKIFHRPVCRKILYYFHTNEAIVL